MVLFPELLQEPADDALVKIIPAKVVVSGGGQHFNGIAVDIQDTDVKGAAAQIIYHDFAGLAFVKSVSKGMDAYGKLYVGDVITEIDNVRVYTSEQLISMLNNLHGGDTVTLTVYRDGEYITVDITLKESPIE